MPPVATILVVEDEPVVRMAMALELEDVGYRILQAPDASRAIAILEREPSTKVIVTDIDMPGDMDGLKLAHAVRNRWPAVHIVLVSGGVAPRKSDLPEGALFFAKPCTFSKLNNALTSFAD